MDNVLFFMIPKAQVEFISEDFSVRQALEKMEYHHYSSVPLLSKDGKYIGALSDGDLLWYIKERGLNLNNTERVSIMQVERARDIKAVSISNEMGNLSTLILDQNFVPIVDDLGHFIGIVTRRSVINYLMNEIKEDKKK